jgi:outer membrane protein assembly factor BamB
MRVILRRKGFDSTSGGTPSPIPPDGTPISLPIPRDRPGSGTPCASAVLGGGGSAVRIPQLATRCLSILAVPLRAGVVARVWNRCGRSQPLLLPGAAAVGVVLAFGLFAAPVAATTASITLKPGVGPPTSTVTVTGTGFGASETVAVDFSATQVGTAATSSTGTFSTTFTVPKSALPGSHPVTATGKTSGRSATQNFLVRTNWAKFHYDLANSGFNPYENVIGPANVSELKIAWTAATDNVVASSPTVDSGVAYISSEDKLYAFSANGATGCSGTPKTCKPLWTGAIIGDSPGDSVSPTVANGVVYVEGNYTDENMLYAFSATGTTGCSGTPKTCKPLWTAATDGYPDSAPAVADGVVYIGSSDGDLYAFSADGTTGCSGTPKTCTPLWAGLTDGYVNSSPAVADGVVYVMSDKLYAFSTAPGSTNCSGTPPNKTCTPLWTGAGATQGGLTSSPAVANGEVYVGSYDGKLYAFSAAGTTGCSGTPKSCKPLWTGATGSEIDSSPAAAYGVVYVGSDDGKLYAFSAAGTTGCSGTPKACKPLWTGATNSTLAVSSSPAVANEVVYVGSDDEKLYAFSAAGTTGCSGTPKSCKPLWTGATGGQIYSSPAVANGVVYVGSYDDKLYAFSP